MFSHAAPFMLALAATAFCAASTSAATYYVDFESGDNAANGTSPQTAWKHSPGDENATGDPASVKLAPGDTIVFRGGVQYHGSIRLTASGAPGRPITLDGNTAGTFGTGRAILDGGQMIEQWQPVESAEQVQGNPRWKDIFYADIDVDISSNVGYGEFVVHRQVPPDKAAPWQRVILTDGDSGLLPIAQMPKPRDAFYPDLPGDFYRSPNKLDVRKQEGVTVITDEQNLTAGNADHYDGMFVGVHGGNNHVYFAPVKGYKPDAHQLIVPEFKPRTYDNTKYAFYNSVRLIENPGEWAIESLDGGRSRIYLLPARLDDGQPDNIGFPVFRTGIELDDGASHMKIAGFLIQRYSGGAGGISVARSSKRSQDIAIADCEIRFVAGHAAIGLNHADNLKVTNCYVHHCPGWTTAVFISRVNDFEVRDNRLVKNSGSGIRHYECKQGVLANNDILDHFGMHSSAINVYEGCADMVIEGNYIQNTATLNRNADNIIFRNNVIDGMGRSAVCFGLWNSGKTGGTAIKDVQFLNNTFVRTNHDTGWSAGIFGQTTRAPSPPVGLVIRGNILDKLGGGLPGTIQNNIYTRPVDEKFMGEGCQVVTDLEKLFVDPANGDFRRKPGGPAMNVGADIAPPEDLPTAS